MRRSTPWKSIATRDPPGGPGRPWPQRDALGRADDDLLDQLDRGALLDDEAGLHRAAAHLRALGVEAHRHVGVRADVVDALLDVLHGGVGQVDAQQVHVVP